MNDLKKIRTSKQLTQREVADRIGVSLRTYITYENDEKKVGTTKYRFFIHEIENMDVIDEEHGVLSIDDITTICNGIFSKYKVDYCYLFGSYAKGKASQNSDVDLLIASNITGLKYFGLVEELREALHKKLDALDLKQVLENEKLLNEILKEGIKIYG